MLALFGEGASAFAAEAGRLDDDGWDRPACGEWNATQLARHVLAVIGWYHDWLDRAEAGDASPAFRIDDLPDGNERALDAIGDISGPAATQRFVAEADRYADRLTAAWDLPFGYPRGTVTAGLHAGMAGFEWHAHAWDLDHRHQPSRPDLMYLAASACLAAAAGRTADDDPPADPWRAMLVRSGRR